MTAPACKPAAISFGTDSSTLVRARFGASLTLMLRDAALRPSPAAACQPASPAFGTSTRYPGSPSRPIVPVPPLRSPWTPGPFLRRKANRHRPFPGVRLLSCTVSSIGRGKPVERVERLKFPRLHAHDVSALDEIDAVDVILLQIGADAGDIADIALAHQ